MAILYCNKDSSTERDHPDRNNGSSGVLDVGWWSYTEEQAYIGFDMTGIDVSYGTFDLIITGYYCSAIDCYLDRIVGAWTESGITWNNVPSTTTAGRVSFTSYAGSGAYITQPVLDITALVNASSGNVFGVKIHRQALGSFDFDITSKEFNSGVGSAYIQYTPRPPIAGKYFVQTTGNDSNNGQFWETPWKTIDKAANTLTDGQEVHIEAGVYDAEPTPNDIFPVNAGPTGIKYAWWGSAGTGTDDGTGNGDVKVEINNTA